VAWPAGWYARVAAMQQGVSKERIPMADGDEFDYFTRWRRVMSWGRGMGRWIKRKHNKRLRRNLRKAREF